MRPCAVAKRQIQLRTSPHVRAYLQRPNQRIYKAKSTIGGKKLIIPKTTSKQRIYRYFLSLFSNGDSPLYLFGGYVLIVRRFLYDVAPSAISSAELRLAYLYQ